MWLHLLTFLGARVVVAECDGGEKIKGKFH